MGHMREYPDESWKALGDWVHDARMQVSEWRDMKAWSAVVGRSDRQLRGLERGEHVGIGTIEAVAKALGIPDWSLLDILSTGDVPRGREQSATAYASYEGRTGKRPEAELYDPDVVTVSEASDRLLLDEIAARLRGSSLSRDMVTPLGDGDAPGEALSEEPPNLQRVADEDPDLTAEMEAQQEAP